MTKRVKRSRRRVPKRIKQLIGLTRSRHPVEGRALGFPEFNVFWIESIIPFAVCAILAGVAYPLVARIPAPLTWLKHTLILAWGICTLCAAVPAVLSTMGDIQNVQMRRAWVRGFPRALTSEELAELLRANSDRYVMHAKGYGAFGWSRPDPVFILEDRLSRELLPIHPIRGSIGDLCEELGVPVRWH